MWLCLAFCLHILRLSPSPPGLFIASASVSRYQWQLKDSKDIQVVLRCGELSSRAGPVLPGESKPRFKEFVLARFEHVVSHGGVVMATGA